MNKGVMKLLLVRYSNIEKKLEQPQHQKKNSVYSTDV